jgi:hypothetical protein
MNELLFAIQILLIVATVFAALRLGSAALTAWVAVQALIANLFVLKQIELFGFEVTASDAFMMGSLLGLNFVQEFFGEAEARKAIAVSFFSLALFALSQLHLLYIPSSHDTTQGAFVTLFSPAPRLLLASMATFYVVQQIDRRFFAWLKGAFPGVSFSWRILITLVVSQALDTVIFTFAGLYGLVASIWDIILVSFALKVAVACSFTSFTRWAKA